MPDYSININTDTGDREAGLQRAVTFHNNAVAERNAQRIEGAEPEPTLTAQRYLQRNFDASVDSYAAQVVTETVESLKDNFTRADQATRDQVKTLLAAFEPAEVTEP